MNDVMIDLETMGNSKNASIIAIGAVFFDPNTGELGNEFYREVNLESCHAAGLTSDASTILWWMKQSDEAREKFLSNEAAPELSFVLGEFVAFLGKNCKPWGNGIGFDLTILESAFESIGQPTPWKFWNERDVRTLVAFDKYNYKNTITFDGVPHYALDDAKHQAKYISMIVKSNLKFDKSKLEFD